MITRKLIVSRAALWLILISYCETYVYALISYCETYIFMLGFQACVGGKVVTHRRLGGSASSGRRRLQVHNVVTYAHGSASTNVNVHS